MTVASAKDSVASRKRKLDSEATSEGHVQKKIKKQSPDSKKKKSLNKTDQVKKKVLLKDSHKQENKNAKVGKSKANAASKSGSKFVNKNKQSGAKAVVEKFDHAKAKEIRLARRKQKKDKTIFEIGLNAKQLWEKFRPDECSPAMRKELLAQLISVVEGKIAKLCLAHDTVRVIESLLLHGDASQRTIVFKEIMESKSLVDMAKSKFGSFIVMKMLKYGKKEQRVAIGALFDGQTSKLMKHKIANMVVELYYNDHANATRRNRMLQDFCGPEFTKFKDNDIRTVGDLMQKYPDKEKDIYKHLHENVCTLINKGCYNHSLVHTVIYNFLKVAKEKERSEVITQIRDACVHIMHSSDGAKASMLAIWYGNNKDRKLIIRNFKTFVPKVATEEHGHMVLLAIFDSMDDTLFVSKTILSEIKSNLEEIISNKFGKKVINYLLAPRSTVLFHPQVLDKLKVGDGNPYSKKESAVRSQELRKDISPDIIEYLINNMGDLLSNGETIFITTIINNAIGSLKEPMEALASAILKENELIENPGNHKMLKKIIQADKERNQIDNSVLFSKILLETASFDNIDAWIRCNRGGFLLVCIFETEIPEVKTLLEQKLKNLKPTLSTQKSAGVECLKSKLGF